MAEGVTIGAATCEHGPPHTQALLLPAFSAGHHTFHLKCRCSLEPSCCLRYCPLEPSCCLRYCPLEPSCCRR